jgi:hypothetical protein
MAKHLREIHLRARERNAQIPGEKCCLLLDFNDQSDGANRVKEKVPEDLRSRVFVLGVQSEPEALKKAGLGSLEDIGRRLGKECREETKDVWRHGLLQQNAGELGRLEQAIRAFLF